MLLKQLKDFFIKYKNYIIAAIVLLIFLFTILFFISGSSPFRGYEKQSKKEIEQLHKENKLLLNLLQTTRDSIEILHKAAIENNSKDTIYINQIKYLNKKTNEEISQFNSLSPDSQYRKFSNLVSEYSKTRFDKDSLPSDGKSNGSSN